LFDRFGGCNRIGPRENDAGWAGQKRIELLCEFITRSNPEQRVLDDGIRAAVFSQLAAKIGDLFDGQTLKVRQEQVLRSGEPVAQLLNRGFFSCGWH
jgi:hypothetical protein